MVSPINSALAQALFGQSTSFGLGADVLTAWASARAGVGVNTATVGQDPNAPIAPVWRPGLTPGDAVLVNRAVAGKDFFGLDAKLYSDLGATGDYRRLFALHTGLATMNALAAKAGEEKTSAVERKQVETQFARGLTELEAFFRQQQFEDVRLAQGDRVDAAQTTLSLPSRSEDYVTPVIHKGGLYDKISGLDPNAVFDIVATSSAGTERTVTIDLSEMGSITRTLSNVVSFINNKLAAAGAASRLETVDQTPKNSFIFIGGQPVATKYTGPRQYALKLDVRAGERVAFEPAETEPAFYVVGNVNGGARLIKLSDVADETGQPTWRTRPGATADPIGANVATGWFGMGGAAPANAYEKKSNALMSAGSNNFEDKLRAAGETVLKLELADGRAISVSTAWRGGDQEAWRVRAGEGGDEAILDDLAERLTQLLHEQGVAAGVDIWESATEAGLSVFTADGVTASSLIIGGKSVDFQTIDPAGMSGGLRDGVFARRFEATGLGAPSTMFVDAQTLTITTTTGTHNITINGGEDGIAAADLITSVNNQLRLKNIAASAALVDDGGSLTLRFDALHSVLDVQAELNEVAHDLNLATPGAWARGGLPAATAGQPFADAVRSYTASGSPLATYADALDIEIDVETSAGLKTISVSVSALERANDPDPALGEWSAAFQARLDAALNAAGVYVGAEGADLANWKVAEDAGHRLAAIRINGDTLTLAADAPALAIGGAFSVERSFTTAQGATGVSDDIAALQLDPTVSVTFETIWGERTVSATLDPGDARTLESAALRLNEQLAAQGYDLGVEAVALSGGGAGLRLVTGASRGVRGVGEVALGADAHAVTLDPIDSQAHGLDPVGAARVADRAARGAAIIETPVAKSTLAAPSGNSSAWFPGRAFDVSVGGGAKIATARSVATGADGSAYVLADLDGDSTAAPIKGARDVALFKYDSAGKLAFTRVLGASQSASGYALAVSAEGKVAIAGSVTGALSGADAAKGGADSFVTLYDSDGDELWTQRRAATANDEVRAVSFASNGMIVVAGKTESALGPSLSLGGSDAFVRGISAAGAELFTRQFGTGRDDSATALLVRDNGAGGFEVTTGGVEDGRGVVRRFTYAADTGVTAGATRDIGFFYQGAINALAYDNGALYVGGEVGADRLQLGAPARGAVAGQEGFVARLDAGLVSNALDRATYLGSAENDAVRGLAVVNGAVYASGGAGGVVAGQGVANANAGFMAKLDDAGEIAWSRTFNSSGGALTMQALAIDTSGASALDVLGLPRGEAVASDKTALLSRSALRAGDEFSIGAEGRRLATIRIDANTTLQALAAQINRLVGGSGRAQIVREDGSEKLKITPSEGRAVRIEGGRHGRDALPALGLSSGIIAKNAAPRGGVRTFGLGVIAAELKLDTPAALAKTKAELSAAISIVRQAYDAILNPNAKEPTAEEKALQARRDAAGQAPEYYTQQLANYQAALARLGG